MSDPNYKYGLDNSYKIPELETYDEFLIHMKKNLPLDTSPDVFGFHPNADITKDMNETNLLLENLLVCSSS